MSGYAMGQALAWALVLGCKWAWALTQAFNKTRAQARARPMA